MLCLYKVFSSVTQSCPTLCGDVIQSSHPLLPLLLLPSIPPSIRVFSNESALCIRWPKYWSFSFNFILSNEHPGLISFRMDWLDLLAVQGTLKSLLQRHSSKASILWCSAFFRVQLSHPYMTTGKTTALTRWAWLVYTLGAWWPLPWCPDRGNVWPQVRVLGGRSGDSVSLTPPVWVRIRCRGRQYTQS